MNSLILSLAKNRLPEVRMRARITSEIGLPSSWEEDREGIELIAK